MSRRLVKSVFLSRVNREFGSYDALIRNCLQIGADWNDVQDQTKFAHEQDGHGTLRKLLNKLRHADAAIHYVGLTLGTPVEAQHAERFLSFEPDLVDWLDRRSLRTAAQAWTYTQWEAYLTLFLQDEATRIRQEPIALLCYTVTWPSAMPDETVVEHWRALAAFEKFPTAIALTEHHRTGDGSEDCARKLADHFRESEVSFVRSGRGPAFEERKSAVEGLLIGFVDKRWIACSEVAALAFAVCKDVLDLPVDTTDVPRFVSNLIERLANARIRNGFPTLLVHLHALRTLLSTRDKDAAEMLGAATAALAHELNADVAEAAGIYRSEFPSCFPEYPLYFAIEIYVEKIVAGSYSAEISVRVGTKRQFFDPAQSVNEGREIRTLREAVQLALTRAPRAVDALGGIERFELMVGKSALKSDDDYRELLWTPWNADLRRIDDEEAEPIVLRWPHVVRTVHKLQRAPPNATVTLEAACCCAGINVLRGDIRSVALDDWKLALEASTLMLWEREGEPVPACGEILWRDVPRRASRADMHHIGVAINPPDAPIYEPRRSIGALQNLGIMARL